MDLFLSVARQLDEVIDAWSEFSDILLKRSEIVDVADRPRGSDLRDDENPKNAMADVVRTLESQLERLRASERRFEDRSSWRGSVSRSRSRLTARPPPAPSPRAARPALMNPQ